MEREQYNWKHQPATQLLWSTSPSQTRRRLQSRERPRLTLIKSFTLCWVLAPNCYLVFMLFCLMSALNPSCCNNTLISYLWASQGSTSGVTLCRRESVKGVMSVLKEPLAFVIFPCQSSLGSGRGKGNSPQLLQAGGSFESLGKVVAANVTNVIPTQAGEAGNRPRGLCQE